jgi:7,8-dihydro-6-hydroxymethylpterin dimethyltransferase
MKLRDYAFLGTTQSLCPECLEVVPAKIIARQRRVYFRKHCPRHGVREDFVCSDASFYDRMEFSLEGRLPAQFGTSPKKGCPYDCGLCSEHEQHTCIGLVEITSSCNLRCPMCYASSGPGGTHLSFQECRRAIDRLVEVEGRAEILQLSGGEPTIHPEFLRILEYACGCAIDIVMINTNGLRFAHDDEFTDAVARFRHRIEVYFQFDGFQEDTAIALRGEPVHQTKLKAIEELGRRGIRTTLVTTVQPGVNDDELGDIVRFGLERSWITGVSVQPATYCGRHVLPEVLENRITFPDVIRRIGEQTNGMFRVEDFMPLPCAHPNCHSLSYAYRKDGQVVPMARFIDVRRHLDLLANGITFNRPRARQLIEKYLGRQGCCGGNCNGANGDQQASLAGIRLDPIVTPLRTGDPEHLAGDFFARALKEDLSPADVFRITITSFLDPYTFDLRRLMKCCTHFVLHIGHVVPFFANNVLYRNGHVPLPPLNEAKGADTLVDLNMRRIGVPLLEETLSISGH